MKVTEPIKPFQGQGEAGQQPHDEQAVGMVVADVFQAVAVLGIIKTLVLDLPAALGHGIQAATADLAGRKIGEPIGLDEVTVGLVLPIANHPHGFPAQGLPRIKVVGVPEFDAIRAVAEGEVRKGERKRRWAAWNNSGRLSFRRATTGQSASPAACRKGAVANSPSTTT